MLYVFFFFFNLAHIMIMLGVGLVNMGNTCFPNAVLSCFSHIVPLIKVLCSCNHAMPCPSKFHIDFFSIIFVLLYVFFIFNE